MSNGVPDQPHHGPAMVESGGVRDTEARVPLWRRPEELLRWAIGVVGVFVVRAYGVAGAISAALSDGETFWQKAKDAILVVPNLTERYDQAQYLIEHRVRDRRGSRSRAHRPPAAPIPDSARAARGSGRAARPRPSPRTLRRPARADDAPPPPHARGSRRSRVRRRPRPPPRPAAASRRQRRAAMRARAGRGTVCRIRTGSPAAASRATGSRSRRSAPCRCRKMPRPPARPRAARARRRPAAGTSRYARRCARRPQRGPRSPAGATAARDSPSR